MGQEQGNGQINLVHVWLEIWLFCNNLSFRLNSILAPKLWTRLTGAPAGGAVRALMTVRTAAQAGPAHRR